MNEAHAAAGEVEEFWGQPLEDGPRSRISGMAGKAPQVSANLNRKFVKRAQEMMLVGLHDTQVQAHAHSGCVCFHSRARDKEVA